MKHPTVPCVLLPLIMFAPAPAGLAQALKPEMLAQFEQKTGLKPVEIPGTHDLADIADAIPPSR